MLHFTQPSPRGLLLQASVGDPLLGGREETALKHPRSPQARAGRQGAHVATMSVRLFIYRLSMKSKILDVSPHSGKHVTASTQKVSEGLCRMLLFR